MRVDPVRSGATLIGIAAAGFLVWLATLFSFESPGGFWAASGLLVGAGLGLGISQVVGGWTNWGWPKLSLGVFFLVLIPSFIVIGWIHLATQPATGWQQARLEGWSDDIGIGGFVADLGSFAPVLAVGLGLILAFLIDTSGPRERVVLLEQDPVAGDGAASERPADMTYAALYSEAQELDIEGRSTMSKDELEHAVANAYGEAGAATASGEDETESAQGTDSGADADPPTGRSVDDDRARV